jgi:hypothetical protein
MINKTLTKNISRLDDLLLLQKAWNHLQTLDEIDQRMLEQDPQKAARIWDKCIKVADEVLRKIPPLKIMEIHCTQIARSFRTMSKTFNIALIALIV